jgi:hypothetical protein
MKLADQNIDTFCTNTFNLLRPTAYVVHQQFNIQQLYAFPTLHWYVLYLSDNKQWLVPHTAYIDLFL